MGRNHADLEQPQQKWMFNTITREVFARYLLHEIHDSLVNVQGKNYLRFTRDDFSIIDEILEDPNVIAEDVQANIDDAGDAAEAMQEAWDNLVATRGNQ